MKRMFRLFATFTVLVGLSVLTACNTVEGAGEDIESAGNAVQDAADDMKD